METRGQALPLFTAICALIATLVVVQLWLLSASVESMLGGDVAPAFAAAIASGVLLLVNAILLRYVVALDRRVQHASRQAQAGRNDR